MTDEKKTKPTLIENEPVEGAKKPTITMAAGNRKHVVETIVLKGFVEK